MPSLKILVMVALLAAACTSGGPEEAGDDLPPGCEAPPALHMTGLQFEPKCFVTSKSSIIVENDDRVRHSLTIDGTSIDIDFKGGSSGGIDVGGAVEPGVRTEFHCKYHPPMVGEILLKAG